MNRRGSEPADAEAPRAHEVDWSRLMAKAQDGDREAYRQLLEGITPYVRWLAGRHHGNPSDAEDVVQDVLLTVHAIRHTYDPGRPFGPWLVAIANRRSIDLLRRKGRRSGRETELQAHHGTFEPVQANLSDQERRTAALREAVARLPETQREAIRLLKLEEHTLQEAAALTGKTVAALKVATHRAMANLRKMLGARSEDL
jgi:RNA polymerase sigma factor (sigma-70 family)